MKENNNRLKELRKALGLTQSQFGIKVGLKGNTLAQCEHRHSLPNDESIKLICQKCGASEKWLRYGIGAMFTKDDNEADISDPLDEDLALGQRIKKIRKTLRLTQERFANMLCVTRGAIANIENSKCKPSGPLMKLLCHKTNCREEWLKTGKGQMFYQCDETINGFWKNVKDKPESDIRLKVLFALSQLDEQEMAAIMKFAGLVIDGPTTFNP